MTAPHAPRRARTLSRRSRLLPGLTIANLILLTCLWVAESFVGERHWLTTGLLYFPQHWIGIPGIFLLTWALIGRNWKVALVNSPACAFFTGYFLGFNIPLHAAPMGNRAPIRVMTYNIHYGSGGVENLVSVIKQQRADIVCLQETRAYAGWPDPVPGLQRYLRGWHMARGAEVATLSRYPISFTKAHPMMQPLGRIVLETTIDVQGQRLTVFNTHISTADMSRKGGAVTAGHRWKTPAYVQGTANARMRQLPILLKAANSARTPVIITGDFNNPPRGIFYRRLTRNYRDAFRAAGWGTGNTFRSDLPVMRIDHILAGEGVNVHDCYVPRVSASDHRPVVAEISIVE